MVIGNGPKKMPGALMLPYSHWYANHFITYILGHSTHCAKLVYSDATLPHSSPIPHVQLVVKCIGHVSYLW